ncbi:MAG: TPM domain-containing protein [Bacteroidales bacterium]|nr:TPM domain-containing protein [Bacteroidales bacterium]
MKPSEFFSNEDKLEITRAIQEAELNTSGEIRVHIESKCKGDALDRAAYIFKELNMHKTELRNGVLFYMAIDDRKFAILGDAGINAVTPQNFWDDIKDVVFENFNMGKFAQGISEGILMAGEALNYNFPYQDDDVNELPDDISFGK